MTDNEIIKDLQSASEWFIEHGRNTNTAIIGICDRAVDLINRQRAEIERLDELVYKLKRNSFKSNNESTNEMTEDGKWDTTTTL